MDLSNYDWYNEDILCAFQPAADFYEYRQYAYPLLPVDSSPKSRLLNFMGLPSSSSDTASSSGVSSADIDAQSPIDNAQCPVSDADQQSIANCPASPGYCSDADPQSIANCSASPDYYSVPDSYLPLPAANADSSPDGDQLGQHHQYSPYTRPLSLIERQLMYQLCSDVSSGFSPLPPSDIASYKLSSGLSPLPPSDIVTYKLSSPSMSPFPSLSPLPNYSYC